MPNDDTQDDMQKSFRAFTYESGRMTPAQSQLIQETPIEISINGETNVLIMFTPAHARELVTGFVFTEGLIDDLADIQECLIHAAEREGGEQVIEARVTTTGKTAGAAMGTGKRISYSSCGICGKENYYELKRGLKRVKSKHRFSMEVLIHLPDVMVQHQPVYKRTGGAHAAVLFDADGDPLIHCEDMGRHNALDKVIGGALIKGISCHDKILLSSGRSSLEMIIKTARAGIPVFVAMSRPTSRAVEAAKFYNITLIDMARGTNRIYSHVRRIEGF
jgi:FdhD protein